ncbi:MAG: hypothetical protein QOG80_1586 [Pseudonocardiales bacterium]|jgi:hypothetical protein|nr:hypothetical protein [Pseudonocardiales bacterium]MDT5351123.1 hypothetical protein [Mycobacterium sp.]
MTDTNALLGGLRVTELSTSFAGVRVGQLFADLTPRAGVAEPAHTSRHPTVIAGREIGANVARRSYPSWPSAPLSTSACQNTRPVASSGDTTARAVTACANSSALAHCSTS